MSERKPTSEIVADLRRMVTKRAVLRNRPLPWERSLYIRAADRITELEAENAKNVGYLGLSRAAHVGLMDELDALRLPCPTCGGSGFQYVEPYDGTTTPCPDCSDGLMSHEQAWKIVAAVFDAEQTSDGDLPDRVELGGLLFLTPWDFTHYLRGIR